MHLTLHPLDAKLVIEQGWGERHPLAGRGPWVPRGFVMVYAPRDEDEVSIVMDIVRAGAWWVGGCVLQKGGENEDEKRVEGVVEKDKATSGEESEGIEMKAKTKA
jgi:hypothetical protein